MSDDSPTPVSHPKDTIRFHDFRAAKQCPYCGTPINWMRTRSGARVPFNRELLTRAHDPEQTGWIPGYWNVRGKSRMVMAPLSHYNRDRAARARHVAIPHRCPQYDTACDLGIVIPIQRGASA